MIYSITLLLLLTLFLLDFNAAASGKEISLAGLHRFSPGDDPRWALPGHDDSAWQEVRVPGSWQAQGIAPVRGMGWYRIRFEASDEIISNRPAAALGVIGNADEVFLNGVKIGGEGRIGNQFGMSPIERLYLVPDNLLKAGEENILAVRVMNVYFDGGIVEGPVAVGDFSRLVVGKLNREKNTTALEAAFMTFYAFAFIFPLFLYSRKSTDRESFYAWLCLLLVWADITLDSRLFYGTGMRTFLVERTLVVMGTLLPACFLMFLMHWHQEKVTLPIKALMAACMISALSFALLPGLEQFFIVANVVGVVYILLSALTIFYSVRAFLGKMHESGPILMGMIGMVAGVLATYAVSNNSLRVNGIYVSYYGIAWLVIFIMYARAARFIRIQKSLRTASEKILTAHEEERRRLARDIHDGIGQAMMAIKLNLQMMNARRQTGEQIASDWLPKLISQVSGSIEELRRVSAGLHPSFLEDVGIGDAFTWYGKQFQDKSGIEVRVEAMDSINAGARIKEHLFRIYQEALSNIGKHASAALVDVSLRTIGQRLCLRIKDDGKGFNADEVIESRQGLGLSTIRERAELLSGVFALKSSPGNGTEIRVEVPLDD